MISSFVKMAIAAGTAEFVAPKSMTINLQEILSGAAIGGTLIFQLREEQLVLTPSHPLLRLTETQAIGAFVITIHHGEDLSAQDRNGSSDPYIV